MNTKNGTELTEGKIKSPLFGDFFLLLYHIAKEWNDVKITW